MTQLSTAMRLAAPARLTAAMGLCLVLGAGCQGLNHTQNGTLLGTGLGTAAGAVIGHQSGHTAEGAVIGAIAGAVTGNVVGNAQDERDAAIAQAQYAAQTALTNYDLMRMAQSGLSEDVMINAVQTRGGRFDLSVDALIQLRNAGVSDRVIVAVQQASAAGPRTAVVPASTSTVIVAPPPPVGIGVVIGPRPRYGRPHWHYHRRHRW